MSSPSSDTHMWCAARRPNQHHWKHLQRLHPRHNSQHEVLSALNFCVGMNATKWCILAMFFRRFFALVNEETLQASSPLRLSISDWAGKYLGLGWDHEEIPRGLLASKFLFPDPMDFPLNSGFSPGFLMEFKISPGFCHACWRIHLGERGVKYDVCMLTCAGNDESWISNSKPHVWGRFHRLTSWVNFLPSVKWILIHQMLSRKVFRSVLKAKFE